MVITLIAGTGGRGRFPPRAVDTVAADALDQIERFGVAVGVMRDTGAVATRPASQYRELAPPAALRPYVGCLWVQRLGPGDKGYRQPVLPDACLDLIALGDRVTVAGPATRGVTVTLLPETVTVGVRFRTGAAPALLGESAAGLRDLEVAVDQLWGQAGSRLLETTAELPDWRDRLRVLVDCLLARLPEARPIDPVGVGIPERLTLRPRLGLADLADEVGLSERQLRRRVEEAVGYRPGLLARILRFQRFLDAARAAGPGRHLALVAAEAGYADQAHLTRESRELAGLPPAALLAWEEERLGPR
ncbi:MAG TPA: helix-turn-helix domain-containing protein [Microlunatus sp.]|nr:helix-turn-helix domain-containing protein [Microlunatus sp.]